MIHVDVNPAREEREFAFPKILVQTSVDGGPWKTQYVFYVDDATQVAEIGKEAAQYQQRLRAEDAARIFVNGCRFAGAEVRATSFGYAL